MLSTNINDRSALGQVSVQDKDLIPVVDDRGDFNIIFIHKDLDDFGLDPYSFRIYSRIVRRAGRGESWENNKNMAAGCCMSEAQVKKSLNILVRHGLIIKESRPGKTCIYRVAPRRNWSNPIPPIEPSNTDSYHKASRNGEVNKGTNIVQIATTELGSTDKKGVSKNTNSVRLATTELTPSYQVANHLATTELRSISNRNKSNKDLARSVGEKVQVQDVEVAQDLNNLPEPKEDLDRNRELTLKANNSAPIENNSQNYDKWECPEPKLLREFMKWLSETAPHIQTARHASNWCNKYPQEADLAWDDFTGAKNKAENQKSVFASYLPQQHEQLMQTYKSSVREYQAGCSLFLEQFERDNGAYLDWVEINHPEWLREAA